VKTLAAPHAARFTPHASRLSARRWLVLSILGGASLLVYWVGLLSPYNLFALRFKPLLDIAKLTRDKPVAQAGFVLTFAALSGLYYLGWRTCRSVGQASGLSPRPPRAMWAALLASLLAINLSMLWLYPIDAADLFDNISRGRITAQHGGNPFYETPRDYAHDPFRGYVAWPGTPSAYGPLWELLAAGTSRLAGDGKLANVLGFKLLGLLFYGGCVALIAGMLNERAPERALQGVCLFAWNPLVIYETAGNGHNDIVMVFFILLGLWALLRGRSTWAALAMTAGALVKFIPILLLPVVVVAALRALPTRKRRSGYLLFAVLACAALTVAAFAPFWRGGDMLGLGRRATLFTTSLPAVVQVRLGASLGAHTSQQMVSTAAALLTGAVVLLQTWRVWSRTERDALPPSAHRASAHILLFYLLFTCLWFQPWYAIWPLALAALLPEGTTARLAVLLSYAALWKTIIFDFFLYRGGPLPPRLWRESLLGPATLGIAWLYAAYAAIVDFRLKIADWKSRPQPAISNLKSEI
jgi:hypothetical protein